MGGNLMPASPWLDVAYTPRGMLEGRRSAEAVVVGAGMTGIGLAYFLARKGVPPVVLDQGHVAGGATGRNAGLLVSGLGEHYSASIEFWGRDRAAAISRLHLENHALLAKLTELNGIDCGYRRSGSYSAGCDPNEEEVLRRSSRLLAQDGFPCTFLESEDMNAALGSRRFFGGIYDPAGGVVDPVRLIRGLARAAERLGAAIFESSPVAGIAREGGARVARTPRGSVSAPVLFLAGNAWLPLLRDRIPVTPVRGQCCALTLAAAGPPEAACMCRYGAEYWRRAGHRLVLGGFRSAGGAAENTLQDGITRRVQSALVEFARDHFAVAAAAEATHRWSGIMGYTPDGLPLVGRMPGEDELYLSGGYTGHGFGYAFVAARWLVELATGGRDEIAPFCRIGRPMRASPALAGI